jgi:hypothetical protein
MRTRIFINHTNASQPLTIPPDAEHVHIIFDSSVMAFTWTLPDGSANAEREFITYNIPETGVGNIVRVLSQNGRWVIGQSAYYHDINPGDTVSFVSDLKRRWLLSDINV